MKRVLIAVISTVCASAGADDRHPVFRVEASPERIAALERAVHAVMELEEEALLELVPDRTGFRFMDCPHCEEGAQEGQLVWSIHAPHSVRCRYCGMEFPNPQYPETRELRVINPVGKEVSYPYWEDASGYRHFFTAKAWRESRVYLSARAQDLGELYQLTGDRKYARRAALILDRFAQYYPGFLVSQDWPHQPKGFVTKPPYPTGGGKWGRWRYEEIPTNLVYAYDSIYNSGELERLSEESGVDVRHRIENDFFRGAIRQDDFHGPLYTNASAATYEGYAVLGRVLGDPQLVHEAVRRCRRMFAEQFFFDGFWSEGTVGYHQATLDDLERVFAALRGYSDPPGYENSQGGHRFEHLKLKDEIPILARAQPVFARCRYPDGRTLPFHDSGGIFRGYGKREPLERSESVLYPGAGHAWLGRGEGPEQVQLHLHFSGAYGHHQADNLNIALFAKGEELVSDIGYTHSRLRSWATSTLSHNTVLIDEKEQYTTGEHGPSDGRLLAWETGCDTLQWAEASAERAYPGLASTYRRAVMLVDAGDGESYAVDLFRVEGGSVHDWVLHGSADHDSKASASVPLTSFGPNLLPDVPVRFPRNEFDRGDARGRNLHYAYIQNVMQGNVDDGAEVVFEPLEGDGPSLRTHLPGAKGTLLIGDAPSVRRALENEALLDQFRMPVMVLRSKRSSSVFAAVHEPYRETRFVEAVELQQTAAHASDTVVLSIRHHGVVDHIVHRPVVSGPLTVGPLHTDAEVAFVRERNGAAEMMAVWGGTELRWRERVLRANGPYSGTVTGVLRSEEGATRDALIIEGDLAAENELGRSTVLVTFGDGSTLGLPLRGVEQEKGRTLLVLDHDPGFTLSNNSAQHSYFPRRTISGAVRFQIRTSANWPSRAPENRSPSVPWLE